MSSAKSNIIDRLSKVYVVTPDPALAYDSTVDGAILAGVTSVLCHTTVTGVIDTAGMVVLIGEGETLERCTVASAATKTITLKQKTLKPHADGERVRLGKAYDLGDPLQGGVDVTFAGTANDINVATQRLPLAVLNGFVSAEAAFKLPYFAPETLAFALGMPVSSVSGDRALATPKHIGDNGALFGSVSDKCFVGVGVKIDGTIFTVELWGADTDYSGISVALARGVGAPIDVKFKASAGGMVADAAADFSALTTFTCNKGQVVDYLMEAGYAVTATGGKALSTTTTAPSAAGDTLLALTAATGVAEFDILEIDTGDNMEHAMVDDLATLDVTFKHKLLKAHASGCAVVAKTLTRFPAIAESGVKFAIGGSLDEFKAADFRMPIGHRSGTASVQMEFPVLGVTQEVLSMALGQTTTIDVSRRTLLHNDMGTVEQNLMYAKVAMQNGNVGYLFGSNCSIQVSGVKVNMNNTGAPEPVTVTARPTNCFRFFEGAGI